MNRRINQQIASSFALLGFLVLGSANWMSAQAAEPDILESARNSPAVHKLGTMFSDEIKNTLNACQDQGGVNLVVGAQADGSVLCTNGKPQAAISYDLYLGTLSDMMAAAILVSLKPMLTTNPGISPDRIAAVLTSPSSRAGLQSMLESAIARTNLLPVASPESTSLLVNQVIERLAPTLQTTNNLETLVGTTEQYGQVVSNFCSTPGMSVAQAQAKIPGLSPVQLYAVCLQESGLAEEIQQLNRRS
jgi:hypothetical protein